MQPPHQHSRINIAELKAQIARKLGPERSKLYFNYLKKLFGLKLNKAELQKVCLRIVGRENIQLHNQLIRATLKNVFTSEVPPLLNEMEVLKADSAIGNKEHPIHADLSNGDILPLSPKKARTGTRDRRAGDRRSALGPNGKTNIISQQLPTTDRGDFNVILENESVQPDTQKLVHHHQGLNQYTEGKAEFQRNHPTKFPTVSAVNRFSAQSKDQKEIFAEGDGKEVPSRRFLHPPLGIPFCAASIGGARRALALAGSSKVVSSIDIGGLLDITTLRERMEQIAATHGVEGVSLDCANILNIGLDVYLKGLIRSSIVLVGSRSQHQRLNHKTQKHQALLKLINGDSPGHPCQMQSSIRPTEVMHEHISGCSISTLDFRVAMELNPQRLGEDWPLLLEKICNRAFDEEEILLYLSTPGLNMSPLKKKWLPEQRTIVFSCCRVSLRSKTTYIRNQ